MGERGADAQLVYTTKDWKVSGFDDIARTPARIKQVFDVSAIAEGRFLGSMKNALNGLHYGFGIPAEQIKVVGALHGPANLLNYDDFIWNKYKIGEWLKVTDPQTAQPAVRNPLYPSKAGPGLHHSSQDPDNRDSIYQDTSMQALEHRGVTFLTCHTATEEQARTLIELRKLDVEPEQVVHEMLAHKHPGVLVVASMSAAIALLQAEGHFTYIVV